MTMAIALASTCLTEHQTGPNFYFTLCAYGILVHLRPLMGMFIIRYIFSHFFLLLFFVFLLRVIFYPSFIIHIYHVFMYSVNVFVLLLLFDYFSLTNTH